VNAAAKRTATSFAALPDRSFLVDGEANHGRQQLVFDLIRRAHNGSKAVLCAFDLIELDGEDLRRDRRRKAARKV
jgi:ATP-dependent DNA ligase